MKIWKVAVIVVVLAILVGGGYYGFNRVTAASTKKQSTVQTVAVQKGTIAETVTAQGATSYPNIANLFFGTSGMVSSLPVKVGDYVKKGQALAKLDDLSISNASKAVAQAKVDLDNARKNLRDAKSSAPSAVAIAQAEAAVAKARLDVKNAEDALDKALNPYASEEVAKGIAQVKAAQEALDKALNPYASEEVAKALAQVKADQAALDDSRRALTSTKTTWDLKLQTDQQTLYGCPATPTKCSGAEDNYGNIFKKYLGMQLTDAQMKQDPETIMKNGNIKLGQLFVRDPSFTDYTHFQDILQAIAAKAPPGVDPAVIYANLYLLQPKLLPSIDDIITEFDNAWTALVTARNQYATDLSQSTLAMSNAEKSVAAAEDALRLDKKNYDNIAAGADPLAVATAADSLRLAQQKLDDLKAGADPLAVAVAQKQLGVAKAQLAQAEENLANTSKDPDPLVVVLREAQVASAQTALNDALQKLDNATIKAPFDGYISAIGASEGQQVGAGSTVVTSTVSSSAIVSMIDPSQVQVSLMIDEVDIARVQLNQPVSISLDALPETRLVGKVTSIYPVGRTVSGVVSYPVIVTLQTGSAQAGQLPQSGQSGAGTRNRPAASPTQATNIQLSMGMTATADIIVQSKENVLLVLSRAIKSSQQGRYVEVVTPQGTEQRTVKVGITDSTRTEITDGLNEGDKVVVPTGTVQTSLRVPGMGGMPTGGFVGP